MLSNVKLKGGALYVSVIISILISIILSLFIVVAYYNTRSVQSQASLTQLQLSLDSGFEIAKSNYYSSYTNFGWQKMPYNNDSVQVKKMAWGCFTLIDVKAKNTHFNLQKTGLFGCPASPDTGLFMDDQSRPIGLAGKIKFTAACYLPKAGIKSAYIEGTSFSDLNSIRPFIKQAPNYIPQIDELYLKDIEQSQSELNPYTDSLISFIPEDLNQSFKNKTAVVQEGSIVLNSQVLTNNIKIIASNLITVENTCQLNNVLLIARKVIFKKGFKGSVHVIAKDTIMTEDECAFNYPSSFCVYLHSTTKSNSPLVRGIFFGEKCQFNGGLLAANNKNESSRMIIKVNKQFQLMGNLYSSNYAEARGNIYGTVFCRSLLLQTAFAYENHILNCLIDPKKYGKNLVVPNWFTQKEKQYVCAKWF